MAESKSKLQELISIINEDDDETTIIDWMDSSGNNTMYKFRNKVYSIPKKNSPFYGKKTFSDQFNTIPLRFLLKVLHKDYIDETFLKRPNTAITKIQTIKDNFNCRHFSKEFINYMDRVKKMNKTERVPKTTFTPNSNMIVFGIIDNFGPLYLYYKSNLINSKKFVVPTVIPIVFYVCYRVRDDATIQIVHIGHKNENESKESVRSVIDKYLLNNDKGVMFILKIFRENTPGHSVTIKMSQHTLYCYNSCYDVNEYKPLLDNFCERLGYKNMNVYIESTKLFGIQYQFGIRFKRVSSIDLDGYCMIYTLIFMEHVLLNPKILHILPIVKNLFRCMSGNKNIDLLNPSTEDAENALEYLREYTVFLVRLFIDSMTTAITYYKFKTFEEIKQSKDASNIILKTLFDYDKL